MTHDEMIAVIRAHKERKMLQIRPANSSTDWVDLHVCPSWNFDEWEYRIEPTPKKRLIQVEELPALLHVRFRDEPAAIICSARDPKRQIIWLSCATTAKGIDELASEKAEWSADLKTWHSFEMEESQ